MSHTPTRHPYHHTPNVTSCSTLPIPPLRSLIDQLIKRRIYIVRKLYLCDRLHALRRAANCKAHDSLFAEWRVEYSFRTKVFCKVHAAAKDAAECYIFAEDEGAFVSAEGLGEGAVDGLEEILAGGGGFRERGVGLEGGGGVVEKRVGGVVDWEV